MAKKILILLVVALVCFASFKTFALDITNDEDFSEVSTDYSFLLDSPLFTQQEDLENNNTTNYKIDKVYGDPVLTCGNLEFYHLDVDYDTLSEASVADPDYITRTVQRHGPFSFRIRDTKGTKSTADDHVWSTNSAGKSSMDVFKVSLFGKTDVNLGPNSAINVINAELGEIEVALTMTFEVDETNHKVIYHVNIPEYKVKFDYSITLTEEGFSVNVESDSIVEESDTKLANITFFPSFGAVKEAEVNGYVVIPSGNGGLIRYEENPKINALYTAPFYGTDLNYSQDTTKQANVLSLPMYGFVHGVNKNACLVEIKEGSEISTFTYQAARYNLQVVDGLETGTRYHQTYLTFSYRQRYSIGGRFQTISEKINRDLNVEYSFLEGEKANYVGLAHKYQESLIGSGVLPSEPQLSNSTQMHVEAFGKEYENGLIRKKGVNMTTVNDLLDINDELKENSVDNIFYTLKGYYNGGYSNSNYSNVKFDKTLGNLNKLDKEGLEYYLHYNPVESRGENNITPSYNLVNAFSKEYYLEEEKDAKYIYYSNINAVKTGVEKVIDKYGSNVSFDGMTQYLYGDSDNNYSRVDTYNLYSSMLGDTKYPMYSPNAYLLKNTDKYLNMSLYHEKMKFITDSVPFLQIVLHGYVDLYSTYINFSSNQELDVLKCIEYGVYPAYLISAEPSHKLSKTLSNNLYATEYARVKEKMISQYSYIKARLDNVVGATIQDRQVLGLGVVEVTYSNNVKIVVNYSNSEFTYNNVTVKGNSAEVIK